MLGLDQNRETFPVHLVKLDEQIRLAWVACELNFSPDAPLAASGPELINRSMTSSRGQLRLLAADRLGPTEQRQEPFLPREIAKDAEHAGGQEIPQNGRARRRERVSQ